MAIDEADGSDGGEFSVDAETGGSVEGPVRVGEYTWAEFLTEFGHGDEVEELYPDDTESTNEQLGLETDEELGPTVPSGEDWERVSFDPTPYLGYHPDELPELLSQTFVPNANVLWDRFLEYVDPETTPVTKGVYSWEHYKWEYYYEDDGSRPRDADGEIERFEPEEALGFDPDRLEETLYVGNEAAMVLDDVVDERTVNVREDLEEDEFFSTADGHTTVTNRYDLEKAVPTGKKGYFREVERYWVNKPYAFIIVFHSEKENEKKYYVVEPYLTEIESELKSFLSGKLRTAIKYSDEGIKRSKEVDAKRKVIEEETRRLMKRYDLYEKGSASAEAGIVETIRNLLDDEELEEEEGQLAGIEARPEPVLLAEDANTLNDYQVEKLLYQLGRDFIGYERIDPIKHDINVEDISCNGYNSPVFVYHSEYEQVITNVYHGEDELDDFVVKLAQRSGKGISKRLPQVDATLPDGSRAQLTLGREVSDHGTNYTIRQFKDVPFTPIDLINWNTFSLDEMAFLWLAIENNKSLIFAGGTASGKTTSLNGVSLFIPSNTKIVSIEDTREVELPQRNWIASVTRPAFSDDAQGDVDEFDLLEAALRQRPDYIVMGEIRGEEGRTLFQVMSTGHTTYTTFHADSVDEVLKRFTTDPINVSKTMFTALDLVSIQTQTRVQGNKVRRNKSLTEINHYEAENDEINVQDVYQWQAETDEYLKMGDSNTLEEIKFDRGWTDEKLEAELQKRRVILAYLIERGLNTYAEVAATVQAFINDPETILTLIANGQLEASLEDLREMESVLIDVDPEKEELVPRPEPTDETYNLAVDILERAEESLFEEYRGKTPSGLASALAGVEKAESIEVDEPDPQEFEFGGDLDEDTDEGGWELGDGTAFGSGDGLGETPSWLEDDEFELGPEEPQTETAADAVTADESETADAAGGAEPEAPPADAGVTEAIGDGPATADRPAIADDAEPPSHPELGAAPTDDPSGDADRPELEAAPDEDGTATADGEPTALESPEVEFEPAVEEPASTPPDGEDPAPTPPDGERTSPDVEGTSPDVERTSPDVDRPEADAPSGTGDGAATDADRRESETDPDAGEDGVGSLFEDMGETLDELDEPARTDDTEPGTEGTESTADDRGPAFDTFFPDRDLDSIFGGESEPETTDSGGRRTSDDSPFDDDGGDSPFGDEGGSPFDDDGGDSPFGDDGDGGSPFGDGEESPFDGDEPSSPGDPWAEDEDGVDDGAGDEDAGGETGDENEAGDGAGDEDAGGETGDEDEKT